MKIPQILLLETAPWSQVRRRQFGRSRCYSQNRQTGRSARDENCAPDISPRGSLATFCSEIDSCVHRLERRLSAGAALEDCVPPSGGRAHSERDRRPRCHWLPRTTTSIVRSLLPPP